METTLRLVPAIVSRYPRLAGMSLDEVQDFQADTMREWAASLTRYFTRQGKPAPRRRFVAGHAGPAELGLAL